MRLFKVSSYPNILFTEKALVCLCFFPHVCILNVFRYADNQVSVVVCMYQWKEKGSAREQMVTISGGKLAEHWMENTSRPLHTTPPHTHTPSATEGASAVATPTSHDNGSFAESDHRQQRCSLWIGRPVPKTSICSTSLFSTSFVLTSPLVPVPLASLPLASSPLVPVPLASLPLASSPLVPV